jgi:hypothetical protein
MLIGEQAPVDGIRSPPFQTAQGSLMGATQSLSFVLSLVHREAAQVTATRVTVADREEPRASVQDGTHMARSSMGPACPADRQDSGWGPRLGSRATGGRRGAM